MNDWQRYALALGWPEARVHDAEYGLRDGQKVVDVTEDAITVQCWRGNMLNHYREIDPACFVRVRKYWAEKGVVVL